MEEFIHGQVDPYFKIFLLFFLECMSILILVFFVSLAYWVSWWTRRSSVFAKIIGFISLTIWFWFLGFTLFVLIVDFSPIIASLALGTVFIFWVIWTIKIFRWGNKESNLIESSPVIFDIPTPINPLNQKLDSIDIWDKTQVVFIFKNGRKVIIKTKNLIKISMGIIEYLWKSTFGPWELQMVYNSTVSLYQTELNESDYKKIIDILDQFVKEWWEVQVL